MRSSTPYRMSLWWSSRRTKLVTSTYVPSSARKTGSGCVCMASHNSVWKLHTADAMQKRAGWQVVFPHISVRGSSFLAGIPPASAGPSVLLAPSSVHSLTHSLTHTPRRLQRLRHSLTHSFTPLTPSLTRLQKGLQCPETAEGLRRAWSPLGRLSPQCPETAKGPAARVVAAGPALSAVSRDCRRACGARGRRWAGSLHSVQRLREGLRRAWSPLGRLSPQCPETAEGPAARVVAAGPALSAVSRDCRRACGDAWSPLGRLSPQCPETAEGPAARVVAAGPALSAVSRDCRRACGARGRRWAGSLRSVQRLQKGPWRAWSPLGRLSPQCPETAEGPAARVVAAGPALSTVSRDCRRACGARGRRWAGSLRSVQRLQKGLRRAWSPLGRLSPQCPGDCRRACGARGRRWAGSLRSVQRLQKGLRRAWSPLGRLSPQCPEAA